MLRSCFRRTLALLLCATLPMGATSQAVVADPAACRAFNQLNDRIRDQTIASAEAQRQLAALLPRLAAYYQQAGGRSDTAERWVFPLRGYSANVIGGVDGSGYQPQGYRYFDGNAHRGHPAHDIFIHDRNQDARDDRTGE